MGGGAMNLDLPIIQFCTSSSKLSSPSTSSNLNLPVSANHTTTLKHPFTASSCSCHSDSCIKLDCTDKTEDKRASGSLDDSVFGSVPSNSEVENAVAVLQSFVHRIFTRGPELKWLQPRLGSCDSRISRAPGYGERVYDTFRMLQIDPSVKRLVISLACDKAVWDAVMSNELVRKLRELPCPAKNGRHQNTGEESNLVSEILRWILEATKAKVTELIEKFQALMEEAFKPLDREKTTDQENRVDLEEKIRSSLILSVVILLIVVVARIQGV